MIILLSCFSDILEYYYNRNELISWAKIILCHAIVALRNYASKYRSNGNDSDVYAWAARGGRENLSFSGLYFRPKWHALRNISIKFDKLLRGTISYENCVDFMLRGCKHVKLNFKHPQFSRTTVLTNNIVSCIVILYTRLNGFSSNELCVFKWKKKYNI